MPSRAAQKISSPRRAQHGVIMLMAGPDVLRFVPSLIMPLDDMSEGFARLAKAIEEIVGAKTEAASH